MSDNVNLNTFNEKNRIRLNHYPADLKYDIPVPNSTFGEYISEICNTNSKSIAYSYQGKDFTYAEIDNLSNIFANALLDLGIKKGDRVALLLPNIPQFQLLFTRY